MASYFIDYIDAIVPLDDCIKKDFLSRLRKVTVPKGKLLLIEGEISDKLWFVKSGLVRGYYHLADGKEVTEWFAKKDGLFYAVNSFIQQIPAEENIEVLNESEVVYISRADLYQLYHLYPAVNTLGRVFAERCCMAHKKRLRDLKGHSAQDRLHIFFTNHKDIFRQVPQRHIASYLGISENYVSKLRAKT